MDGKQGRWYVVIKLDNWSDLCDNDATRYGGDLCCRGAGKGRQCWRTFDVFLVRRQGPPHEGKSTLHNAPLAFPPRISPPRLQAPYDGGNYASPTVFEISHSPDHPYLHTIHCTSAIIANMSELSQDSSSTQSPDKADLPPTEASVVPDDKAPSLTDANDLASLERTKALMYEPTLRALTQRKHTCLTNCGYHDSIGPLPIRPFS
jgi:hypothetical protein